MKYYFLLLTIVFIIPTTILNAQDIQSEQKPEMMLGYVTKTDFMQAPFVDWYEDEYQNYMLDIKTLYSIKDKINDKNIIIIFGSWCSDSRREVPRFVKILDYLDVDYSNVKFIAVDREKKAPVYENNRYQVENVPTFIIFDNNKEIGRIIESPDESLEIDLMKILK